MKTRTGFVSNSSSSSFVIFGAYIDNELENVSELRKNNLRYYVDDECGPVVGVDPDEMESTETLEQFRARIAKKLAQFRVTVKPEDLRFTGGTYMC